MNIAGLIVIFSLLWWLIFFMLLPIGVQSIDNPEEGHDAGAPSNPNIGKKMLITTIVSFLIVSAIYVLYAYGYFDFLDKRFG